MIKNRHIYILFLAVVFCGCEKYTPADVMTSITFTIQLPENLKDTKMNAEIKCTNVNTGEIVHKAGISEFTFEQTVLKGYYIIHLDGVIVYTDVQTGKRMVKKIRGYVNDVSFIDNKIEYSIPVIFL